MFQFRLVHLTVMLTVAVSLFSAAAVRPASAQTGERCFRETNQCISGRIREYWERNGGLAVFGFPVSAAKNEVNRDTGRTYLTQWFERNRFELHPENRAPYDVLLGRLGDDALQLRNISWQRDGRAPKQANCLYFDQTGHNVCDQDRGVGFRTYWTTHGLEFDGKPGVSYGESLALFGLPLTEVRAETNSSGDQVLTQWFERARFEYHPNNRGEFRVLLGLLGNEIRRFGTSTNLATTAPWVRTGNQIISISNGLPTLGISLIGGETIPNMAVSPDGRTIAYHELTKTTQPLQSQLVLLDTTTGARRTFVLEPNTIYLRGTFSPDGRQFAFTMIYDGQPIRYELRVVEIAEELMYPRVAEHNSLVPMIVAWNEGGLFATYIRWATDALPEKLVQINPTTGAVQTIFGNSNLSTQPSPDGQKAAIVTGQLPIGQAPKATLSVLDRATNRQTTIVPESQVMINRVRWSPDGAKLVHARTADYGQPVRSLHVTNADGSGEQVLRLDGGALRGQLFDVVWRNTTTLLLLTQDGQDQLAVFEISLNAFNPASARRVQNVRAFGDFGSEFVYVPR